MVMMMAMMEVYSELANLAINTHLISHYLHALYKRVLTLMC